MSKRTVGIYGNTWLHISLYAQCNICILIFLVLLWCSMTALLLYVYLYIWICVLCSVFHTIHKYDLGLNKKVISECIASHLKNDSSLNVIWFSPFYWITFMKQALGYVHGAKVVHASEPVHGRLRYNFILLWDLVLMAVYVFY